MDLKSALIIPHPPTLSPKQSVNLVEMSGHVMNSKVENTNPPITESWKSCFTRRLASMKISEEYEYLAKIYHLLKLEGLQSNQALLFALRHASSSSPASDFRDPEKEVTKLDPGSKVCIIGAGMAGTYQSMRE